MRKPVSVICSRCGSNDKRIFKEEKSIEILKTLSLINNIESRKRIYIYFKDKYGWAKNKSRT